MWTWSAVQEEAFESVNNALASALVLIYFSSSELVESQPQDLTNSHLLTVRNQVFNQHGRTEVQTDQANKGVCVNLLSLHITLVYY